MSRIRTTVTRRRLVKRGTACLAVLLLAGGLAACGSASGASGSAGSITLYSGQHEQTTQSLVNAFEKATGINVNVRNDDEDSFADEIVAEGSHSLADVFYTENSPALEYLQARVCWPRSTRPRWPTPPRKYNSPQGDWVGVSARVSVLIYNPSLIKEPAADLGAPARRPEVQGRARVRRRARPTSSPSSPRSTAPTGRRATKWLEGIKANAGSHIYPDNETIADEVNRGAVAFGVVNQYYWYRMRAEIGASNVHSQITYFAPHDPGYVLDISGAAILKSSKHQAAAQRFLAFIVSKQGQEIIAHSISFEYPIDLGVTTTAPGDAVRDLQPNAITIAELETARPRSPC